VAPLGSTSLIFNFLFARWLLGTHITWLDLAGTLVVVIGVIGVVAFGNIRRAGIDQEANISFSTLQTLWGRPAWIFYFIGLEIVTIALVWAAGAFDDVLQDREAEEVEDEGTQDDLAFAMRGGRGQTAREADANAGLWARIKAKERAFRSWTKGWMERWAMSRADESVRRVCGLLWSLAAGLLAGQTLVFAKSFVKLVANVADKTGSPGELAHPLFILIALLLAITAVTQVWCLNKGERRASS
jgi:uncharacterized membrane protein